MPKKRKDGNYEKVITFEINGQKFKKHFYYKNEFELVEKVNAYKAEIEEKQKIYFKQVAEEWEESHYSTIRSGTKTCYDPALKRAKEEFDGVEIKDVKPIDVKRLIDGMAKKRYSSQTVTVQLTVLNLIFNFAVLHGYLETNPASVVSVPRNLPKQKRKLPSDAELKVVLNSANVDFGLFAYLILLTGCRRGEALALQWQDIDFENKLIYVNKTVSYMESHNKPIVQEQTKTESGTRTIVMLDDLYTVLLAKKGAKRHFVFGGEIPLSQTQFRNRWQNYLKETGLSITPHQLRHGYATILYDANVDEKVAQELMGHSKIQLTRDVYTHIRQSRLTSATNNLNDYIKSQK